jgi:serine/threonine protein kinase
MTREVVNLASVHQAGGRVPQIIDHNATTEIVANTDVPLYLVMDFIEGETLRQLVERRGPMPLPDALAIVKDICTTIRIAHGEGVLHRDLKPENVVVQLDGDSSRTFILDYGLSFNDQADNAEDLTRVDEGFANKFLFLPDSFGQDQRDRRSDLTAIAALLFYALTGQVPGALLDAQGRMPHQRYAQALQATADARAGHQVRTLFSKAFAYEFDLRFQSVDELMDRLNELGQPDFIATPEDPIAAATRAKDWLHRHSRPTILARFRKKAEPIPAALNVLANEINRLLQAQEVTLSQIGAAGFQIPGGVDHLLSAQPIAVQLHNYSDQRAIQVVVGSSGGECIVFRVFHNGIRNNWTVGDSQEMFRYAGSDDPPIELIVQDTRTQIARLIDELLRLAGGKVPG